MWTIKSKTKWGEMMNYYAKTDIGKVRSKNQDQASIIVNIKDQIVAVVCDGMGGHGSGEIASRVVMEHVISCFNCIPPFDNDSEVKKWLMETINEADIIVKKMAMQNIEHNGMGTTIVVAVFMNDMLYISHVGDSRAYILKNAKLVQVTKDHTLVNELIERGAISEEEGKNHSQKHVLMQAIGAETNLNPSLIELEFADSLLLLCSDGLYNSLDETMIVEVLSKDLKVPKMVDELIDLANEHGGYDNIAVAIIDNREGK